MDAKVVNPHLMVVEDFIVAQHGCFQVLLIVEYNYINTVLAAGSGSVHSPFVSPGVDSCACVDVWYHRQSLPRYGGLSSLRLIALYRV